MRAVVFDVYVEAVASVHACAHIQVGPKKWGHRLMAIILSNLNRLKFFSLEDSWVNL